jgi:hypothetical protein
VWWQCGRWAARIKATKGRIFLGYFDTKEEATRAYDAKAIELFGEFACLNFQTPGYRWLGEEPENLRDGMVKARIGRQRGENHYLHKLSERGVRMVKWLPKQYTAARIAKALDVCQQMIYDIRLGKYWKHLEMPSMRVRPYLRPGYSLAFQLQRLR